MAKALAVLILTTAVAATVWWSVQAATREIVCDSFEAFEKQTPDGLYPLFVADCGGVRVVVLD